jgi:LPXTG-motif cell wall-anchored protein
MRSSRLAAAATTAALLAFPATALAAGAGDDQYQDPFADEPAQTQQQAAPAPAEQAQAPAQAAPAPAQASAPAAAPALPRTGAETAITALGGAALLAAGLALRRRSADVAPR